MVDSTTTNGASVVNTWTQESGHTERTRIEWDGRVKIASIQADATKKTSFAFVLLWVARALFAVAGIVIITAVGLWAWEAGKGAGNA